MSPYEDHLHLDGNTLLLRAINPEFVNWVRDEDGSNWPQFSHRGFTAMSQSEVDRLQYQGRAMSVGQAAILAEHFDEMETAIDTFLSSAFKIGWGVAGLYASDVRQVEPGLGIRHDEVNGQPWHALVFPKDGPNINTRAQKQLRAHALVLRAPSIT